MRIDKRMLESLPEWMSKRDDLLPGWLYIGDEKYEWFPAGDYAAEWRYADIRF